MARPTAEEYFAAIARASEVAMGAASQPQRQVFRIAGLAVDLEADGDAMFAAVSDAFSHLPRSQQGHDLTITAWSSDGTGCPLPPPPSREVEVALRGELPAVDGGRFRFSFHAYSRTLMAADVAAGRAYVISQSGSGQRGFERASPLRAPLSWLLPPRGRLVVHGAAVASGGGAALLIGRGGAGKSTLAATALQAGWDFLGDDLVALSTAGETDVYSLYCTAKVRWTSPFGLPSSTAVPEWHEADVKRIHRLDRHYRPQMRERASLAAVVLVDRAQQSPSLTALSTAEATATLAATTHLLLPGAGVELVTGLATALRSVPCWRFDPGTAPEEGLALLASTLEESDHLLGERGA